VLLSLDLPRKTGLRLLQKTRAASDVPLIAMIASGRTEEQIESLNMGADDFVVKPIRYLALMARLRAVLRRAEMSASRFSSPGYLSEDLTVDYEAGKVTVRGKQVKLTRLEFRLLGLLVRNEGKVVLHEELIGRMWGENCGATTDHLKVYVSRLRAKVELPQGPRLFETVRGLGYRFKPGRDRHAGTWVEGDHGYAAAE
jgi:DNA-binding response OmpR family regulator